MKKLMLGLSVIGFAIQLIHSQEIELPEVNLDVNHVYLNAIESKEVPEIVQMLEKEVAFYDLKVSDFYNDEYDNYTVSFYIPEGSIIAAYNTEGKILSTVERFKNIKLQKKIVTSILEQYPNWEIVENVYKVDYYDKNGIARKQYNIKLKNSNKHKTVKVDGDGDLL